MGFLDFQSTNIPSGSMSNINIVAVAYDETGQYALAGGNGVYYSSDYGVSWRISLANVYVTAVALIKTSAGTINALAAGQFGFWYSVDLENNTWSAKLIDAGDTSPASSVALIETSVGVKALVGKTIDVWYSDNLADANAWTKVLNGKAIRAVALVNTGTGVKALVGDSDGVYYSSDSAQTYTHVLILHNTYIKSVALVNTGTGLKALAGGDEGVWYSSDSAQTWTPVLADKYIYSVALVNTGTGLKALAGGEEGVYYSTDPATINTWTPALDNKYIRSVALIETSSGNMRALAGGEEGTWYSTDPATANAWTPVLNSPNIYSVALIETSDGLKALAGGDVFGLDDKGGIWYSTDPATQFTLGTANFGTLFYQMVYDETGQYALAGGANGVYYSSDYGATWQVSLVNKSIRAVALLKTSAGVSALAGGEEGAWYSTNPATANAWTPVLILNNVRINSVALLKTSAGVSALAGGKEGAWYSTDPAQTWTQVLTGQYIFAVVLLETRTGLKALAGGAEGVYYSTDPATANAWTPVLVGPVILAVALLETRTGTISALVGGLNGGGGGEGSAYYSADVTQTWSDTPVIFQSYYIDKGFNSVALINTSTGVSALVGGTGGVWYSTNPAQAWTHVLTDKDIYTVALIETSPGTINALAGGTELELDGKGGIWSSSDPAQIWSATPDLSLSYDSCIFSVTLLKTSVNGVRSRLITRSTETIRALAGGLSNEGIFVASTQVNPNPPPPLISNICFPRGTPIQTDQGRVHIDRLNPARHTINNQPILHITQTVSLDKYLISFEPHALTRNVPHTKTLMSKDHKIEFEGRLVPAERFLNYSEKVKKVIYTGEILYNVLLDTYATIHVNGLICETLHPDNSIALLYRNKFSEVCKQLILSKNKEAVPVNKRFHINL